MTDLAKWMKAQGVSDRWVANQTGISQSEINRLRRGTVGASRRNAARLEALTGLVWWTFMAPIPGAPARSEGV